MTTPKVITKNSAKMIKYKKGLKKELLNLIFPSTTV